MKKRQKKESYRRSAHCAQSVVWSPGPGPSLQVKRAPLCAVSTPPPANLKRGQRPHYSAGLLLLLLVEELGGWEGPGGAEPGGAGEMIQACNCHKTFC